MQEGLAALSSDEAAGTPAHVFTYCALSAHAARVSVACSKGIRLGAELAVLGDPS